MKKKTILITGASSGMGKDTAKDLIQQGHTVYCAARSVDKMKDLETLGGKIIKLDISDEESIIECVETIIKAGESLDVLWNNAGYGLFGSVEETPLNDAKYQFDVNMFGLARLTQLIIPHMRKKQSGLIINTSSIGGKIYSPLGAWYHATKHALEGFSDCLRIELEPFGIKVVILEPGAIKTDFPNIMSNQLLAVSGKGPYSEAAERVSNLSLRESGKNGAGSPTSVISKTIQKIIKSKRPKTRYAVGKFSTTTLFIRKMFSDRFFDKVLDIIVR